jgi:hypothetical protein
LDYIHPNNNWLVKFLEEAGQPNFEDIRPMFFTSAKSRLQRKFKAIARSLKMRFQYAQLDFKPLIDRIIEIDNDDKLYRNMLKEPWLKRNLPPDGLSTKSQWMRIFESGKQIFKD